MAGKRDRRGWGAARKLPSGRWQASYAYDLARHTAPDTFKERMDAELWLAEERRLIERELWTPPKVRAAQRKIKGVTLGEYATTWIEHRNIRPTTRTEYRRLLAGPLAPLAPVELRHLTPQMVRAWHSTLSGTPRRQSHAYGLAHAVLATAVADGIVGANPCAIPRAMNPPRKREPVILEVTELAAVADAIKPERLRALVLVSAWCGLRWSEVIELRRKDIAPDASTVTVARQATHRGACRVDTPKSGKARIVVVPSHIRADVLDHLARHVAAPSGALVFPAFRDGCHLNDSVFAKHFRPAVEAAGRDGVRIHDLRHFAGTHASRVGSTREVMQRLGHSTVAAAMRYQSLVDKADANLAERLSRLAAVEADAD
ncbi:site-specific integrase [Mycobacterium sp.]|uniref:site-specific integrase n=1 Tax=Mycobacterium sp. TaxID=1785 RepID=UPI003F962949